MLKHAVLCYGSSMVHVKPHAGLPIPTEFDFGHPEDCARRILAIMSNASGGHLLLNCKLSYSAEDGSANITSSGCHVYYAAKIGFLKTREDVVAFSKRLVTVELGGVRTDQYGGGYRRAVWTAPGKRPE